MCAFSHPMRGTLYLLLAVLFWGASASLAKYLFMHTESLDPLILTQTRTSFSFLIFAGIFAVFNRQVFKVRPADLIHFALLGIFGVAVTNFTYYYTVKESTVATAILIQYTAPALVMIYAVLWQKSEKANAMKIFSLIFAFAGCVFAVTGGNFTELRIAPLALATGIASAFFYAYMLIKTKSILRKYSVWTMLTYAFGFAFLFWLVINPPHVIVGKGYSSYDWQMMLLFAVVSILIPNTFFSLSMKYLEATTVSIMSILEPVVAIVVAFLALNEMLTLVQSLGAMVVMLSLLLLQINLRRPGVEP